MGDVITSDAKHTKNIQKRKSKGIGSMVDIIGLLKQLCLGEFHFEIAVLLRQTMLLSSVLLSSETWLRLTKTEIDQLEMLDEMYMRKVLASPANNPKVSMYLCLGLVPIRFLIKAKRMMFLHYI